MWTVPTGFSGVPPEGPAMPVMATPQVLFARSRTATAIALATDSETAPLVTMSDSSTPKRTFAKVRLGVLESDIVTNGAVSESVARAMAVAVRERAKSTWGVAITGIAGPSGGTPEKPVGTVHIAVSGPGGETHQVAVIPGSRSQVRMRAAGGALALLLRQLR